MVKVSMVPDKIFKVRRPFEDLIRFTRFTRFDDLPRSK